MIHNAVEFGEDRGGGFGQAEQLGIGIALGRMRMRVSIARALVTDPDLLLLDEPFAALDEITRMALNDDLLRLWEARRTTVVFVTHSVFESVYLSTRIAVMTARPGRIAADLPIELPQPREPSLRTSPGYAALCARVSGELQRAMAGVPPGDGPSPRLRREGGTPGASEMRTRQAHARVRREGREGEGL